MIVIMMMHRIKMTMGDEDDHHIQMCLTRVSKENERMVAAGSSRRPSYCVCDYGQLGARKNG